MDFQTDIFDLNDIIDKLKVEDEKAGATAYAENLNRAIQYLEKAIGFLEEAERTQPRKLKAVK